ncbi:MAG: OB-fold domain-containing protein [Serpentinimonas sp.]|nr:OB-fold domain-containing protein [Serpentinimonas sp.]
MSGTGAPQGVQAMHQAELSKGRFLIQRCGDCGGHIYFPREICPHCGGDGVAFVEPTGFGTVYAVTTVSRKAAEGGDYNVSLIDLDEGVRLMSRVDSLAPSEVKIGQRVKARVIVGDGHGMVVFDAVEGVSA